VPFTSEWKLPRPWPVPGANLTLIANPNSPTGTMVNNADLESVAGELQGALVVDEAYVDFAESSALPLHKLENVIVTRSMSKSYSLAGLRFGFGIARPALVHELNKVKDSYNCDTLSLVGAAAALDDQDYMRQTRARIVATRARLEKSLTELGFNVLPSQANFVWARRGDQPVQPIFAELKRRRILVRYMNYDGYDGLRISVGTDVEIDRLLEELRGIV
jgi:histidinol-phosphate aminotransferase